MNLSMATFKRLKKASVLNWLFFSLTLRWTKRRIVQFLTDPLFQLLMVFIIKVEECFSVLFSEQPSAETHFCENSFTILKHND